MMPAADPMRAAIVEGVSQLRGFLLTVILTPILLTVVVYCLAFAWGLDVSGLGDVALVVR